MDTSEFIALCDGVQAEERTTNLHGSVYEEGCVRIKDALTPNGEKGTPFSEFKQLRTGFIYLSIIDDSRDYSPYYYILEKISGYFNGSTALIADWSNKVWKDVIAYAKSLPEYPKTDDFSNELTRVRERERARAAKRLTALGAVLSVKDCDLMVDNQEGVCERIEQLLCEIGGENALNMMLSKLMYKKEYGRYLVPHQGNQPMLTSVELELPFGYLFNLCLKHLKDKGSRTDIPQKWKELMDILKDYCVAVYDSQKFDIWTDIIFKQNEVVRVVHEMILRFNLYTLPQSGVSFTLAWCRYLCKVVKMDSRCEYLTKERLSHAERMMNWAMDVSSNKVCKHVKKGDKEGRILEANKTGVETQVFIRTEVLNSRFTTPDDYKELNGMRHPVIETDDEYILLPKPLAVWSWYEAIYNIIKKNRDREVVKGIGYVMEDFIRNKMRTHGLAVHTGEYKYDGVEGEVDFLVQGKRADVYIESKKKSLSLKAQGGDDYYIWGDLYEFIDSQMQCVRLENGVRNHGPITLTDKKTGETYAYEWKDKVIEPPEDNPSKEVEKQRYVVKATMTLKEYGPMQDKVVLSNIIKSLFNGGIGATFDANDTEHDEEDQERINKTYNDINEALVELTDYYNQIGRDRDTFFCRFYSMEQMYYLIRKAKDQDQFVELLRGSFVTTGTENFWNEAFAMELMNRVV